MTGKFLSPTSINTYLRCPRKYYLKYVKGLKEKPNIHLIRGKAIHDSLARFHQTCKEKPGTFEEMKSGLLSFLNHSWVEREEELRKLDLPEETLNECYRESEEMLIRWLRRNIKSLINPRTKPETEVRLFSRKYRVMGIIDTIHYQRRKAILTDYKTSKKEELTQDIKVQMAIYALLYRENHGTLPCSIVIDFLKHDKAIPFKVTDEFSNHAIKICKEVHQKTFSTNEEDYPCKCGGWCEKDFI